MAQNAAHLVKNQSFVIPNYNWWGGYFYFVGLTIYDLLAGNLSLGRSKYISRQKTLERLPNIEPKGLRSGVVYQDCQFDDARLAINIAQTAVEKGACVLNYCKVTNLLKSATDQVIGVVVEAPTIKRKVRDTRQGSHQCDRCIQQCHYETQRYGLQKVYCIQPRNSPGV